MASPDDAASLFRRANELVRERAAALGAEGTIPFICECRDTGCLARVEMTLSEYDGMTARPDRVATVPGHAAARDHVVEETGRYTIVERVGTIASSS